MGEKNNAEMNLYYSNGEKFEKIEGVKEFPTFQTGEVETTKVHHIFTVNGIDCSQELSYDGGKEGNYLNGFNGGSASFKIKRQKSLRCKSRKRFVKLLMSKGINRNMAVKMAELKPKNESYDLMWFWIRLMCIGGF